MRERFKCPGCGLVQWKEEASKRCGLASDAPPAPAEPAAPAAAPQPERPPRVGVAAVIAALLAALAAAWAWRWHGERPAPEKAPAGPPALSLAALDELCPLRTGTFACRLRQQRRGESRATSRSPS